MNDAQPDVSTELTGSRTWTRRGLLGVGALALGGAALSACAPTPKTATPTVSSSVTGPTMTLKMSQVQIADSPEGRAAVDVAKRVNELTNGTITITVFPNSTLSSDPQAVQQLVSGALDIGVVSIWTNLVTEGRPFELPYAFSSIDDIRKAFAGTPGKTVKAAAIDKGVHLLDWWVITYRNVYGDRAIHTPDDFKGVKIRTQGTAALNAFYTAVGAHPQTVASNETYLALQTKQVNMMESSYQFAQQQKHYEVAKFASTDQHGISTLALMISDKTWDKMSPSQQQAVQQAFTESVPKHDTDSNNSLKTIPDFLTGKGMAINAVDLAPFQAIAKGLYPQLVENAAQQNVLTQLQAMGYAGGA